MIIDVTTYLIMNGLIIIMVWIGMSLNHQNDKQSNGPYNWTHEAEVSIPYGGLMPSTIHSRHVSMGAQRLVSPICLQRKMLRCRWGCCLLSKTAPTIPKSTWQSCDVLSKERGEGAGRWLHKGSWGVREGGIGWRWQGSKLCCCPIVV